MIRTWLSKLVSPFRQRRLDDELDEEIRTHLAMATEENRRRGMSPSEARQAAHRSFGGVDQTRETCHDIRGLRWLDDLRSDLRFGIRGLARNPGFTATAALTLSIGIGGTAAMFSVTNAFLFRPFPAPNPEQLVVVAQLDEHDATFPHYLSYPEYLDYRDRNDVFEGLAAHGVNREVMSARGVGEPVWIEYVSRDFFGVLRVDAVLGRTFLPDEGRQPGDAAVVVLSHRAWQNRFGGDPSVVGRAAQLGMTVHTVIGVLPESFVFNDDGYTPELYVAVTQVGLVRADWDDWLTDRNQERFQLIGRLRPGVTVAEARANLSVLTAALATEYPDSMEHSALWVEQERQARPGPGLATFMTLGLTMLMTLASLVLLIACANVATLLISRGLGRQREMALRAGLGATRLRLVRQLLSESILLALLGGTGGALAALWVTEVLSAIDFGAALGGGVFVNLRMDWRVFVFTAVAATLTGLIAGFAPATRASRVDLIRAIGTGGRGSSAGATGQRLTSGLVVAQVALSLVLLVCAGLFVRSGQHAATLDVGFRTDHVLLVTVDPLAQGYAPEHARGFFRDVANEVEALPGVRSASWARQALQTLINPSRLRVATLDGGAIPETDPVSVYTNDVDPAFFDTVDLRVIQGRGFRDEDATDGRAVAVISETAARRFWPDQDPLGKRLFRPAAPERPFQVIGIVRDAYLSYNTTDIPAVILLPFGQRLSAGATLHVHTEGPPTALASAVTEAVRRHDPTLAVYDVTSMDRHVYDGFMLSSTRLGARLIGAFGALGLLLAAVGLYGVVAYSVTQRLQEFSVRTALGATAAGIVRLALGRAMILTGIGLALGFLAAAGVTPFTTGFLVDVNPTDPVVFGVTGLLLAAVALLACLVPSRRAATADPLATLNAD